MQPRLFSRSPSTVLCSNSHLRITQFQFRMAASNVMVFYIASVVGTSTCEAVAPGMSRLVFRRFVCRRSTVACSARSRERKTLRKKPAMLSARGSGGKTLVDHAPPSQGSLLISAAPEICVAHIALQS